MISIPTYSKGEWQATEFSDESEFAFFVLGLFKEPGEYEFDETAYVFNSQARNFNEVGYYCKSPFRSKDFIKYWDDEKIKCIRDRDWET